MVRVRSCLLYNQELVDYKTAWAWQQRWVSDRKQNADLNDVLILLEHPPVYTLGQASDTSFLKFDPTVSDYELHRIERGGEVTYHCPGQLVGYAILNLNYYRRDLHWYLRQLEEVIMRVLAVYGLKGDRIPGLTGVWIDDRKVAAIGIKVSRWITMHGFAINVCPDLSGFDRIVPCGIADKAVGSLEQFVPEIRVEEVRAEVAIAFAEVFGVEIKSRTPDVAMGMMIKAPKEKPR